MPTSPEYYQKNKEKILAKSKERYKQNKGALLEYQRKYRVENRNLLRIKASNKRKEKYKILLDFLGGKCSRCLGVFPNCVYDFHHKDPKEKEFTIGEYMGYSLAKLKKEASKCELLCANCHRIIHGEEE